MCVVKSPGLPFVILLSLFLHEAFFVCVFAIFRCLCLLLDMLYQDRNGLFSLHKLHVNAK